MSKPPRKEPAEIIALRATNSTLVAKLESAQAEIVELKRAAPLDRYAPIKQAAYDSSVRYNRALTWHRKGLIDSRKDAGRIVATVVSLVKRRVLLTGR
jgi:hypothetical protein